MKIIVVLLLIGLAVQTNNPTCGTSPMLKSFFADSGRLPKEYRSSDSIKDRKNGCAGVWKVHGSCCSDGYVERIRSTKNKHSGNISARFVDNIEMIFKKLHKLSMLSDKPSVNPIANKDAKNSYIKAIKKCSSSMQNARTEVMCDACRPDSAELFVDGKTRVSIDSCKAMLNKCSEAIEATVKMVTDIGEKMIPKSDADKLARSWFIDFEERAKDNQVIDKLDEYNDDKGNDDDNDHVAQKLCGIFYTLHSATFIEQLEPVIEAFVSNSDNWFRRFNERRNHHEHSHKHPQSPSRSLGYNAFGKPYNFNSDTISYILYADSQLSVVGLK